jgi:hypothetical protein
MSGRAVRNFQAVDSLKKQSLRWPENVHEIKIKLWKKDTSLAQSSPNGSTNGNGRVFI